MKEEVKKSDLEIKITVTDSYGVVNHISVFQLDTFESIQLEIDGQCRRVVSVKRQLTPVFEP